MRLHRDCPRSVPVMAMLAQASATLEARAERLREKVGQGAIVSTEAFAGGGSLPEEIQNSSALKIIPDMSLDTLAARLRCGEPAVVGRIADGGFLLDMMAVRDEEVEDLAAALRTALG